MSGKQADKSENKMRKIQIDKVIINCSVGEPGDKVNKACKVLKVSLSHSGSR